MKKAIFLLIILSMCCGREKVGEERVNRFTASLRPASEIATIERLTQDGRCIFPIFAPGDSIIYFRRLLASNPEAASGVDYKDLIKPFGINIHTRELLTLSSDYSYPALNYADKSKLPAIACEPAVYGMYSADSGFIIFETAQNGQSERRKIYLLKNENLSQLTYGDISCFMEKISHGGRYLTALLGWDPSSIIILDLESGRNYRIERENNLTDYMTIFSSDDKMIAFIRSDAEINMDGAVFGDIWLVKFKDPGDRQD